MTIRGVQSLLPPMTFVKNPVDTGRPGQSFPQVVSLVARDPAIDAVLVFGLSEPSVLDPAAAIAPGRAAAGKPVLFGTLGMPDDLEPALAALAEAGVPAVLGPERLVLAARALDADARGRWGNAQAAAAARATQPRLTGPFDEARGKELLTSYGIATPSRRLCGDHDMARRAFKDLKKPVVVKIAADDIAHKTEAGGVILGVKDETGLAAALEALARIPTRSPGRVLIEEMASPGVELIIGGVRDPSWGPCIVIGIGGVTAEAMADSAVRLAPLTDADIEDMLQGLRGKKLLDGFRNLPQCDRGAIAHTAQALSRLMLEHPEVTEIEINPVRMTRDGALALDALVVLAAEKN